MWHLETEMFNYLPGSDCGSISLLCLPVFQVPCAAEHRLPLLHMWPTACAWLTGEWSIFALRKITDALLSELNKKWSGVCWSCSPAPAQGSILWSHGMWSPWEWSPWERGGTAVPPWGSCRAAWAGTRRWGISPRGSHPDSTQPPLHGHRAQRREAFMISCKTSPVQHIA